MVNRGFVFSVLGETTYSKELRQRMSQPEERLFVVKYGGDFLPSAVDDPVVVPVVGLHTFC